MAAQYYYCQGCDLVYKGEWCDSHHEPSKSGAYTVDLFTCPTCATSVVEMAENSYDFEIWDHLAPQP